MQQLVCMYIHDALCIACMCTPNIPRHSQNNQVCIFKRMGIIARIERELTAQLSRENQVLLLLQLKLSNARKITLERCLVVVMRGPARHGTGVL